MKPIFGKAPPLGLRLILAILASIALIVSDGQSNAMIKARSIMETAVGGLYYLANTPRTVLMGFQIIWLIPINCKLKTEFCVINCVKKCRFIVVRSTQSRKSTPALIA